MAFASFEKSKGQPNNHRYIVNGCDFSEEMITETSWNCVSKNKLKWVGISCSYCYCRVILMMFFMNPIETWSMKTRMRPIKCNVFNKHENKKLPKHSEC